MLETAIAFPLLIAVAIGLVQFAIYYHAQTVVTGAVQEGARHAAAEDRTLADGVAYARTLIDAGLGPSAREVTVRGAEDGRIVLVEAQGELEVLIPWVANASLPLLGRATVHKERFRAGPGG